LEQFSIFVMLRFLGYFKKYEEGALAIDDALIDSVVAEAHSL